MEADPSGDLFINFILTGRLITVINIALGLAFSIFLLFLYFFNKGIETALFYSSLQELRKINFLNKNIPILNKFMKDEGLVLLLSFRISRLLLLSMSIFVFSLIFFILSTNLDKFFAAIAYTVAISAFLITYYNIQDKIIKNKLRITVKYTPIVLLIYRLLRPIAYVLKMYNWNMYKYISKKDYKLLDFSEDELNPLLTLVANLDNLTARHVMTSRLDILAIDKNAGFQYLKDIIRTNKYSRFPVYHENIDNLEGILYVKDLIPYLDKKDDFDWQFLLRNCYFIPEGKKLDELLKDFKEKQVHMAIVLDEYGGMAGLVTLEDIIEEIIGDIKDEYDVPKEIKYNKLDNKTYIFDASISISDFCYITGTDKKFFQISGSEINSINDLLMQLMIKIPKVGYHISFYKFNFTIIATGPEKILRVKTVIKDRQIEKKPA